MQNLDFNEYNFQIHPSKQFIFLTVFLILLSFFVTFQLALQSKIKCVIGGAVLLYGAFIIWRDGMLYAKYTITSLSNKNRSWMIEKNGRWHQATLRGDSTVTRFVSILRFRLEGKNFPVSCLVFKDSLGKEDYRRLMGLIRMSYQIKKQH